MPVVNTTNSFSNNEQITSTKLNDIMDNSSFVSGAVVSGQGLEITVGGQMQIKDLDVTTAKIADSNVTQAKLGANVVGNGPAFRAFSSTNQAVATASDIRVVLGSESFDTNSNFASSRFTPSVAGYYFFHGVIGMTVSDVEDLVASIYKNGSPSAEGARINGQSYIASVSGLIYMNGSTDYAELYVRHVTGSNRTMQAGTTNLQGYLVRSA